MGEENDIVSLANGGDICNSSVNTKPCLMSSSQLITVVKGVEVSRRDPTLFKPKLIINRSKNLVIPFHESFSMFQTIVKIQKLVASGSEEVEFPDDDFSDG